MTVPVRLQAGDLWGGLAAAVVALPAAIGFGVAVYEPLGQSFNAQGVMAEWSAQRCSACWLRGSAAASV